MRSLRAHAIDHVGGGVLSPHSPDEASFHFDSGAIQLYDIDHAGNRSSLFFRARPDKGVMCVPASGSRRFTDGARSRRWFTPTTAWRNAAKLRSSATPW